MPELTPEEINRRVAKRLGILGTSVQDKDGAVNIIREKDIFGDGKIRRISQWVNFCTDPAAADLVRLEIERRGWEWTLNRSGAAWEADVCHPDYPEDSNASGDATAVSSVSPHHALCLAFLAATETE